MHTYEFRRRLVCIALLVAVPLLFLSCWQPELHEMNEENTTKSSVESVVPFVGKPLPEASYTLTVRLLDDGGFVYVSNLKIE